MEGVDDVPALACFRQVLEANEFEHEYNQSIARSIGDRNLGYSIQAKFNQTGETVEGRVIADFAGPGQRRSRTRETAAVPSCGWQPGDDALQRGQPAGRRADRHDVMMGHTRSFRRRG